MATETLKTSKSPGTDQIQVELIKSGDRTIRYGIYKLILSIGNKKELPEEWKESIILTICKKGDETDCSNYRGISLLPTMYKLVWNFLLSRLTPYAEEIIGDHQCEIRCNRSDILHSSNTWKKKWEYNEAVHKLFTDP